MKKFDAALGAEFKIEIEQKNTSGLTEKKCNDRNHNFYFSEVFSTCLTTRELSMTRERTRGFLAEQFGLFVNCTATIPSTEKSKISPSLTLVRTFARIMLIALTYFKFSVLIKGVAHQFTNF